MTIAAFDTLKTAETLAEAGIEEAHAKAIVGAMRNAVSEGVATKSDLEAGLARLEAHMYVGFLATIGVVVALVKLIP